MMITKNDEFIREPVGRVMAKISRMFLETLRQNLASLDIQRSFYPLLLIEAGKGKLTQNELAKILSCNKVEVVRIIDYLSSNGYVLRKENAKDRRKYNLVITEKAEKYIPEIKKAVKITTAHALNNIPDKKVDELYSLLKIINNNLSEVST